MQANRYSSSDRALNSLGPLMQLGGSIGVIAAISVAIPAGMHDGRDAGIAFFSALLYGVRAGFHRAAGSAVLYRSRADGQRAIATYLWVAVCQIAITLVLWRRYLDVAGLAQVGAGLLTWPVIVGCYLAWLRADATADDDLRDKQYFADDRAAHSPTLASMASVVGLATILGVLGAITALIVLAAALVIDPASIRWRGLAFADVTPHRELLTLLTLGFGITLLIRAALSLRFGLRLYHCNRTESVGHTIHAGFRYARQGMATAASLALIAAVIALVVSARVGVALAIGVGALLIFWAWPRLLQRLCVERNYRQLFELGLRNNEDGTQNPAPRSIGARVGTREQGATILGWLVLAAGTFMLSQWLATWPVALARPEPTTASMLDAMLRTSLPMRTDGLPWRTLVLGPVLLAVGIGLLQGTVHAPKLARFGALFMLTDVALWTRDSLLAFGPNLFGSNTIMLDPLAWLTSLAGLSLLAIELALAFALLLFARAGLERQTRARVHRPGRFSLPL